jgi:hypothetical protein
MSCADDMAFGPTGPEKLFQSGLDLRLIAQNLHAERALEVAMRMPNPLGIGQCLWGTAFTNPGRGCRKPKGHMDAHDLYGQSGIPANLKTREEQEAWAIAHVPAWELPKERFQKRLDERGQSFRRRTP